MRRPGVAPDEHTSGLCGGPAEVFGPQPEEAHIGHFDLQHSREVVRRTQDHLLDVAGAKQKARRRAQ